MRRSETVHANLLPDGLRTEGHHFYKAVDVETEKRVGHIWLKVESGDDRKGFIYDVYIDEGERGKGYGRAMMLALEAKAKRMKIDSWDCMYSLITRSPSISTRPWAMRLRA